MTRTRTLLVTSCLAVFGCAPAGEPRLAVSGLVSYKGTPVDHAGIIFVPDIDKRGQGCNGVVWNGRYAIPAHEGPSPGEFHVLIIDPRRHNPEGAPKSSVPLLPERYESMNELHVTIPAGRKSFGFDFDLKDEPAATKADLKGPAKVD